MITLKNGHTMLATAFNGMVKKIVNDCNQHGMPVNTTNMKIGETHDLTLEVENHDVVTFRHIMSTQRYDSTTTKNEDKTVININFN